MISHTAVNALFNKDYLSKELACGLKQFDRVVAGNLKALHVENKGYPLRIELYAMVRDRFRLVGIARRDMEKPA